MTTRAYDHLFKFVLIGNTGVGKSCLLLRYADDEFTESFISTIGVDFRFRTSQIGDRTVKLQIWDTAGQERFQTITSAYYRSSDAIAIVYDVTRRETFAKVPMWMNEAKKYVPDIPVLLIANKSDQSDRDVTSDEGRALARELDASYIETSARTGEGVAEAFHELGRQCLKRLMERHVHHDAPTEHSRLTNQRSGGWGRFFDCLRPGRRRSRGNSIHGAKLLDTHDS